MGVPIHAHDAYSIALAKVLREELEKISYTGKYNPGVSVVQVPDKDLKYQAKVLLLEVVIRSHYYDSPTSAMSDAVAQVRNLRSTHPELFL